MYPVGIGLILILIFFAYYFISRWKYYVLALKLEGPFAWPLFGNALIFLCDPKEMLNRIVKSTSKFKSPLRLWMGPRFVLFVTDPDQLQALMQSSKLAQKSDVYTFLEPFMGKGLFTSSASQNKNHRKIFQPLFGPTYVEGYSYLFQKHADKLMANLASKANGEEFDVLTYLHDSAFEATMDIMLEDKNANHSYDYKEMPAYVRRFYHIFSQRVVKAWYHVECLYRLSGYYKEQQMMVQVADTFTKEIMDRRVPEILTSLQEGKNKIEDCRTPCLLESTMEMALENPNILSVTQFKDHLMTLVFASQDTQSSAIAFTLMMLGMHQDIQDKVEKELLEVLDGRSQVDYSDLDKLKYMEMCIKESMRLFPLGPFLPRESIEDFTLGKLTIPKGCTVVLGLYNVHKNPNWWEKPDEFYPDHFLEEAVSKRHPYAYLPFSAGPRRCIAQKYSYTNMKIIISTIMQKYRIVSEGSLSDLKLTVDVSIRPINGYLIKLISK